ncbi:unnamed protein product [Heterobilharzia americana]|nr:unnamed protein product [Heterobilharzia americana]CAH8603219.1 unnamed protein product [Heterobilharzia americana]
MGRYLDCCRYRYEDTPLEAGNQTVQNLRNTTAIDGDQLTCKNGVHRFLDSMTSDDKFNSFNNTLHGLTSFSRESKYQNREEKAGVWIS